jgi:aryl-alcohol dehydrogenase-like predicted oxidoreductase
MNLKNEVSQEKLIKEHLLNASISRREFLLASIGLAVSGTAVLSSYGKALEANAIPAIEKTGEVRNFNQDMLYRRLGRTNLVVSEVSSGGAFHYGPGALKDTEEIQRMFDKSLELGINYFDTSPDYGTEVYYAYLSQKRERYFLATKVNTMSAIGARTEVENSLKVMKTDYLDVIQTHYKPQDEDWSGTLEALQELHKLKEEGKVRFVGFTHHSYDALGIALNQHSDLIDTILLLYSFHSETDGAEDVIKLAHSKDIGTIAMKVFRSASETWEKRVETFQADTANWARLKALMDDSTSVAQACIKYVIKNPLLSTALLGMQSVKNVCENAVVPKMMDVAGKEKG